MKDHSHLLLRVYIWALLIFAAGSITACVSQPVQINSTPPQSIRVVMDNNYPPYAFANEKGELQGILIDQWKLWEQHTGIKVEVIGLPWDKALNGMKDGEYDVIDTIFYTEERAEIFDFTKPYADIDVRIFFPVNVSGIGNVDSLRGFHVAVKSGDANAEYLIENGISELTYYDSYEEVIRAATKGTESIFVMDQPPALYFLHKYNLQNQFDYSEPLYGGQFHRAVKKGNENLLALINSGFESISTEEYKQVDERWFGVHQYTFITQILPYAGAIATPIIMIVVVLFLFNTTLRARVKKRTQELENALSSLKSSENRFRELFEFLPIPIGIADDQGRILEYNQKFVELYGYTPQDISTIAEWILRVYPDPEYREKVNVQWNSDVANAIREKTATPQREYRIMDKFGSMHDVEISTRAVGNLWITSFHDITERKKNEIAIRKTEAKYRALIEHAPEIIYLDRADKDGSNLFISPQIETLLGYSTNEFAKNPNFWHEIIYPEDYPLAVTSIENTIKHGHATEEYRIIKRDGSILWVRDTSVSIYDENGETVFIQGFLQDITQLKAVDKQLKDSEKRYRTIFEDSPVSLLEEDFSEAKKYIDDLKKKGVHDLRAYFQENPDAAKHCASLAYVVDVNKEVIRWVNGKSKSEMLGRLSDLLPENGLESFLEEILALEENKTHYEVSISRRDFNGQVLHLFIKGIVIPNYEETWERVLITIIDLTKQKQAEEDLAKQIERLHTLRTIDQGILSNFDLSENLKVLLHAITDQLQVDAVSICLLNDEKIQFAAGQGFRTGAREFFEKHKESGLTKRILNERKNIYVRNLQEDDYSSTPSLVVFDENFTSYWGVPLLFKDELLGVLEIYHRSILTKDEDWGNFLEMLAGQAAITINSAQLFYDLQASNANLENAYDSTLEGWSRALDLRDRETEGHTRRVTEITMQLARHFGFSEQQITHIKRGAILHDIGKMGIPDSILLKPGSLTNEEWVIMRKHPVYAYEMLSRIEYLRPALDIPHYHHEWWNGSGYPAGLKGTEIPISARIFAAADVWDALTSDRPYRRAWTKEKTIEYLRAGIGTQFDPDIIEVFLKIITGEST